MNQDNFPEGIPEDYDPQSEYVGNPPPLNQKGASTMEIHFNPQTNQVSIVSKPINGESDPVAISMDIMGALTLSHQLNEVCYSAVIPGFAQSRSGPGEAPKQPPKRASEGESGQGLILPGDIV